LEEANLLAVLAASAKEAGAREKNQDGNDTYAKIQEPTLSFTPPARSLPASSSTISANTRAAPVRTKNDEKIQTVT